MHRSLLASICFIFCIVLLCSCNKEYVDYSSLLIEFKSAENFPDSVKEYINAVSSQYRGSLPADYSYDVLHSKDNEGKSTITVYNEMGKCIMIITYWEKDNVVTNVNYSFYFDDYGTVYETSEEITETSIQKTEINWDKYINSETTTTSVETVPQTENLSNELSSNSEEIFDYTKPEITFPNFEETSSVSYKLREELQGYELITDKPADPLEESELARE